MPTKHISKDGRGRITSKITKPKDWAYRTPSEGRAKHVHSPRAKKIVMVHGLWTIQNIKREILGLRIGHISSKWNASCESPARKLTAQDIIDIIFTDITAAQEVKINHEHRIMVFPDLTDILSGAREEAIAPALTKDEIEIAKRHSDKTSKPGMICKKCGEYKSECTCKRKK